MSKIPEKINDDAGSAPKSKSFNVLVDDVTKGISTLAKGLDNLQLNLEKQTKETVESFVKSGPHAKERALMYILLKQNGAAVEMNTSLEEMRAQFTEELGQKVGFYYDHEKGWRGVDIGTGLDAYTDTPLGISLPSFLRRGVIAEGTSEVAERTLNEMRDTSNAFDQLSLKLQQTDAELAKTHSRDWYVQYKVLSALNFYADPYATDSEMAHEFEAARGRYLSDTVNSGNPFSHYLSKIKSFFETEYAELKVETPSTEKYDPALAKSHTEDWYVNYKTLKTMGSAVDLKWDDAVMAQHVASEVENWMNAPISFAKSGKKRTATATYVKYMRAAFAREFKNYTE